MKNIKFNIAKLIKYFFVVATLILLAIIIIAGVRIFKKFGMNPEAWVAYLKSFGAFSFVVLFLFQVFQVFIALIPGEVIEIVAGVLFNPFLACLVVYLGIVVAVSLIFAVVRLAGKRFTKIFVSEEKLKTLRFINTKEKLSKTVFVLFLIPGTPKDLFVYFFALTPIKYSDFLIISSFARFPTVISSVLGGNYIADGEYLKAGIVFVVTAMVSIAGTLIYNSLKKKWKNKKARKQNNK